MHRALAARLDNPEISLFEALKQGGFDYDGDDDPNSMDSENITLGQRKNQLSRRLRLAKKEGHNAAQYREIADASDMGASKPKPRATSNMAHGVKKAASKQGVKQANKYPGKNLNLGGRKRDADEADIHDAASSIQESAATSLSALQERLALESQKPEPPQLAAKYHPDFQHIIIPRAGGLSLPPSVLQTKPPSAAAVAAAAAGVPPVASPQNRHQFNLQDQLLGSGYLGGLAGFNIPGAQAQASLTMPPPTVSNVAVRSLSSTAQSVGLTLEQLALTLSTSKNLMKLLSDISTGGSDDDESQKKKHDLALRLHEYESKTLSSRCMLLAGYGHEIAKEGSVTQLKFALEAWQNEGKRLQDLLKHNSDVSLDDAPLFVAEKQTAHQKMSGHAHSHDHSHGQPCILLDGRHLHRLDGRCGHRAILHQPQGGPPHIDFVVGDKVECYGGMHPFHTKTARTSATGGAIWPSQFKCDELTDCRGSSECKEEAEAVAEKEHDHTPDCQDKNKPKTLDLNAIDLNSSEWTSDVNDDVLMSLLHMGNKDAGGSDSVTSEPPEFNV